MAINRSALKLSWGLAALISIVLPSIGYHEGTSESWLWPFYVMVILSLPSSWIMMWSLDFLTPIILPSTGYSMAAGYGWVIACSALTLASGYVQWFILLPRLWRKWEARSRSPLRAAIARRTLMLLWVLVAAVVLASTTSDYGLSNAFFIVNACAFLAFSFPSGWIVAVMLIFLFAVIEDTTGFAPSFIEVISIWLTLTVAGYVQWFVLLPRLWRKWKARRANALEPPPTATPMEQRV